MRITTLRPRTMAALFVAVLPAILPAAARAANESLPTPKALLAKMQQAHRSLGPNQVTTDVTVRRPGKPLMEYSASIAWNDPNHVAVSLQRGAFTGSVYVNGSDQWTYLGAPNVYMRGMPNGMPAITPNTVVEMVTKDVDSAGFQKDLAHAKVSLTTADGQDAYRLFIPRSGKSGAYVALLVGKDDGLMRKIVAHDSAEKEMSAVSTYTRMASPFPASTFQFHPPAGARQVANDAN